MKKFCIRMIVGAILIFLGIISIAEAKGQDRETGTVIYVVDGDTVDVLIDGEVVRVRLVDIDTPEKGEPGYQEAKDYVISRVKGREVVLVREGIGFYGRTLGHIHINGVELNTELYCEGYAEQYHRSYRIFDCDYY